MSRETTLEQRFDDGAMRHFDCGVNRTWLRSGYARERRADLPGTEAVSAPVSDADAVIRARLVDTDELVQRFRGSNHNHGALSSL
jgi:hypothetical protein